MSNNCLIRGNSLCCYRSKQGRLEPAAVLVGTFEIEVGRAAQIISVIENCGMGRTGVEPNVHDVALFFEMGTTALCALISVREEVGSFVSVPSICAFLTEYSGKVRDGFVIDNFGSAIFTIENRNRNAPGSLT